MAKATGDQILVKTEAVRELTNFLTTTNNSIEQSFSTVDDKMKALFQNWDGKASNAANTKYNEIKNAFLGESGRAAVMNNYIRFLQESVATGYEASEQNNTKLSDLFK